MEQVGKTIFDGSGSQHQFERCVDLTNAGTDVSQATILDNLQVTVTLPYSAVAWSPTSYYTNSSTQISTTVYWISANPQSYPSTVTAPTGS